MSERLDSDILREIDPATPTFKALMEFAGKRLKMHERTLKTVGLPAADTEAIRGRISELENLLGLDDQVKKLPPPAPKQAAR